MPLLETQPKRVRFADIILAIKQRFVDRGVVANVTRVALIARNTVPKVKAEKLVYLRPRRGFVSAGQVDAAGRGDFRVARQLDVILSLRTATDAVDRDEQFLTNDEGRGILDFEEDAWGAMEDWQPSDADGNVLTIYPLKVLSDDQVNRTEGQGKTWWGDCTFVLDVAYHPPIDPDDPPAEGTEGVE